MNLVSLHLFKLFQIARGLAVTSVVCIIIAILLSIMGMECTRCMDGSKRTKTRVALFAAGFWIFSSLCIGIAVSYYGHQVRDLDLTLQISNRNEARLSVMTIFVDDQRLKRDFCQNSN